MDKFEMLNRMTREWNNRNVDRYNPSTRSNYSSYDQNRLNNETYKSNNGQYSSYYSNR